MPRQVTTMMTLGEGARCWVYLSFLRPSKTIEDHFPNQYPKQRLDDLIAIRQGVHTRTGHSFPAIWFTSETFPGAELLAAKRYVHVIAEGDPDKFFEVPHTNSLQTPSTDENAGENQGVILDFQPTGDLQEDIATVLAQGLIVDNDNEPAPENIPTATTQLGTICPETGLLQGQRWHWNGICNRKAATNRRASASFNRWMPTDDSFFDVFLHWMPVDFLENTMVVGTSTLLKEAGESETSLGELLVFLGLWLLMATVIGFTRRDFFSSCEYDEEEFPCPYHLSRVMSGR